MLGVVHVRRYWPRKATKEDFWQLMYNKEDKEDNKEDFFDMCTRKTFLATDVDVGIHLEGSNY